jgi:glycosyl transferase family 10 (putative fucosyltransferase)
MGQGDGNKTKSRQIAFLTRHAWPWERQTEDEEGRHKDLQISWGAGGDPDWLVVFDDISDPVRTRVPVERRILFVTEPPGQKRYLARAVNQFGILVSPYPIDGFRGTWVASQPGINWFYGVEFVDRKPVSRFGMRQFRSMKVPEHKATRISVVCSTKRKLPGHRARVDLLQRLTEALPGQIDVFGRGFKEIGDKAEVIDPYRYHLVLENNDCPHFWTEKLADAYLGYSLPIYSGCANVGDYFPLGSLVRLPDVHDHEGVIAIIRGLLQDDPWAARLSDIRLARDRLLDEHNIFSLITRITEKACGGLRLSEEQVIYPGEQCTAFSTLFRGTKSVARRLTGRKDETTI